MKRSFKNLFMIIAILATSFASNLEVNPAEALGGMTPIPAMPGLPVPPGAISPLDQGQLKGIWGADNSHIFAVGYGHNGTGTLVKPVIYQTADGTVWDSYSPALPYGFGWGTGHLEAVWGKDDTHVYAVGRGGVGTSGNLPLISIWDGSDWVASSPDLPGKGTSGAWDSGQLFGVWGTTVDTTTHVWAVGKGGSPSFTNMALVVHWNGSSWTSRGLALPSGYQHAQLVDVWGTSNTDIYAVGLGQDRDNNNMPLLFHYDGNAAGTWNPITFTLPATDWTWGSLEAIWGSGAGDIYVVGQGGNVSKTAPLIYHSVDGVNWTGSSPSLPSTYWTSGFLKGVWGDGTNVYISGHGYDGNLRLTSPLLYRKTSNGWVASSYPPSGWASGLFEGIWGYDADHVYGVGYGLDDGLDTPLLAYAESDGVAPGPVTNLAATAGTLAGSVILSWTAPADDGPDPDPNAGPVSSYVVQYSTSDDLAACTDGMPVAGSELPVPVAPGATQTMTIVTGLAPSTLYYFSVCALDEEGNSGDFVTPVSATSRSDGLGVGKYDDRDPNWKYTGSIKKSDTSGPYKGTLTYLKTVGTTAEFKIEGNAFTLWYMKYTNQGTLAVYVDDNPTPVKTLNQKGSSRAWQVAWTSGNLGSGPHKVKLVHAGGGTYVNIDAIQVRDILGTGTYESSDPRLVYLSSFSKVSASSASGGSYMRTKKVGDTVTFWINGSQLSLWYMRYKDQGKVDVYIDGVKVKTLSQTKTSRVWKVRWTSADLGPGVHKVVLKHAGPSGMYVNLDSLQVSTP